MQTDNKKDKELYDWVDALENLILFNGKEEASSLIKEFISYAENKGLLDGVTRKLPFENTISSFEDSPYPGNWDIEQKIRHYIRWNALITVLKANQQNDLGGHISKLFFSSNII